MTAVYRLRQGLRAVFAFSQAVDVDLVARYLTPDLLALFRQMRHSEQLHSLNVLRDVSDNVEETPRELAIAALLHDVGKVRYPLWVWQKTLAVLVRAVAPGLFQRWSQGNPLNLWKRPFVVYVQHPAWSAAMLRQLGAPEAAVWLVEHHQENATQWETHPHYGLLCRLQAADDAN